MLPRSAATSPVSTGEPLVNVGGFGTKQIY